MERVIGTIQNYYGYLKVTEEYDKYFWIVEDVQPGAWEEIPKYLFDALNKFEDERKA